MRFNFLLLLAAYNFATTIATPVPSDFDDIERRWSEGQSEAQIHAAHSIRDATPAWPVARTPEAAADFDSTTDELTMVKRGRNSFFHKRNEAGMIAKMRAFVNNYMAKEGKPGMIEAREEAPVLKPRKGMRYRFTA